VKAELQRQGLIEGFVPNPARPRKEPPPKRKLEPDAQQFARIDAALSLWRQSIPLKNTLGQRYFVDRRGLHIGTLDHTLRWHDGLGAIIALMTDPTTREAIGVHRTYINPDGTKRERKMLGRQGVVRLSLDDDVTEGLGLTEGIEDGLSVLLSGWAPVWAATSAGAIERFPVLPGIGSLTIFADTDAVGMRAAQACAARWRDAGAETNISYAKELSRAA
jgi:hypothetical protein